MRRGGWRDLRGPSLSTTWGLLAWLLVPLTAVATLGPIREVDVYWHIRMGADILASGRFTGDPAWTYGPADPSWGTTQAGAEILLYAIHSVGSWTGLLLFRVVMAALVMVSLLLATTAVVRARAPLAIDRSVAVVSTLVAIAMVAFVQERPQSLSLLLLPWIGVLVMRVMYADRWPRWWVIGLLVMVWSWFHGAAVLVGPLLFAAALIHALGAAGLKWLPALIRSIRKGWAVILAALVVPLIGPLGPGYYAQASKIQEAASGRILEWQAPDANNVIVWLALALVGMWVVALVRLAASSGRVWRTFRMDAMLVIATVAVMMSMGRYLGVGVLLLAPLIVRRVAQAWTRPSVRIERIRPRASAIVLASVSVLVVLATVVAVGRVRPVEEASPLSVWAALAAQEDERRVFVAYVLGGQAGLLADVPVSIDGRADRYGGAGIDANLAFVAGRPGWEKTLAEYPGTTDVVVPSDRAIVQLLEEQGWSRACQDGAYTWLTAPGIAGECAPEAPQ